MKRIGACAAVLAALAPCAAPCQDDLDALALADRAPAQVQRGRAWQLFADVAAGPYRLRQDDGRGTGTRLSLDAQLDTALAPGVRLVLADRVDLVRDGLAPVRQRINTLKEAYLSWQVDPGRSIDAGRINARQGVAAGYNPSDFFRMDSVRSLISADPASLKKNRLGSVMLRGQQLWHGGALAAIYSPQLGRLEGPAGGHPGLGGTNGAHRYLLAASTRLSDKIAPQWLAYGELGKPVQLGLNLSLLAGASTVLYAEWSGGRTPRSIDSALGQEAARTFHHRAALGVSYTTSHKVTVTGEFDFNGAGMGDSAWNALPRTAPRNYLRYRQWLQAAQELSTRRALFFQAAWQDAMRSGIDINAMLRRNAADGSALAWVEARRHWPRYDLALQWQSTHGRRGSEFGDMPQADAWQAVFTRYF